ncbi:hypothetical protein B0T26DRAFT_450823 [Lasiosphaeria miniovina]|uniref:Uncharacterized protein n=1 Tax=Lasiosphaeria miniovina TaxID=1954250 RepID=A0AA39ZZS0_9PEZI|nr:uncharacterized protein B0T26DRAFT_450823 [Lasiosphaeria miniovina]KAK0706389.1 hypothetical protein B0T26DRAFT_450823 [Lasiosphaeria miniovina]
MTYDFHDCPRAGSLRWPVKVAGPGRSPIHTPHCGAIRTRDKVKIIRGSRTRYATSLRSGFQLEGHETESETVVKLGDGIQRPKRRRNACLMFWAVFIGHRVSATNKKLGTPSDRLRSDGVQEAFRSTLANGDNLFWWDWCDCPSTHPRGPASTSTSLPRPLAPLGLTPLIQKVLSTFFSRPLALPQRPKHATGTWRGVLSFARGRLLCWSQSLISFEADGDSRAYRFIVIQHSSAAPLLRFPSPPPRDFSVCLSCLACLTIAICPRAALPSVHLGISSPRSR